MMFLDRLAEQKIAHAIARGELIDLPGKGKPIPDEPGMELIAPECRVAYRILKNAGYLPEEVRVLKEIEELVSLLQVSAADAGGDSRAAGRFHLLLRRLGEIRGEQIWMADAYYLRIVDQLSARLAGCSAK